MMVSGWLVRSALLLAVVACAGCGTRHAPVGTAAGSRPSHALRDTHERLNGVLWTQTSGEFWALTQSTYARATRTLEQALRDPTWTAAIEQTGDVAGLPPAVILDLDETVLDNGPFQGQLVLDGTSYVPATWSQWETVATTQQHALPGAVEFLRDVERRGVAVFFVTNRAASEEALTLRALHHLGLRATSQTLLSSKERPDWTSDKTSRRAHLAQTHRILLLVGDDMGDFLSVKDLTPAERLGRAMEHAAFWGERWVLLPNPAYGSWEAALSPGVTDDAEVLARKRARVAGFRP